MEGTNSPKCMKIEHSHTFAYIFHSSKRDLLVNGHFEQLVPLEDQNKYAWSVKQDEKQIIGFFSFSKLSRVRPLLLLVVLATGVYIFCVVSRKFL